MKLALNQLDKHLQGKLATLYLLHGDEPLLIEASFEKILQTATQQGFNELQRLYATSTFSWSELADKFNNLGLFSAKAFIKLSLPSGAPGKAGAAALQDYLQTATEDNLLVIVCDKLETSTYKTAWYKAIEKQGAIVQVWQLQGNELNQWLKQRFAEFKLQPTAEALAFFTDKVSGNLLAATQEIEKLYLIYGPGNLSEENIAAATTDQAHFEVFNLVAAWLNNQSIEYLRILRALKAQGEQPTLILWALSRDVRQLAQLAFAVQQGESLEAAIQTVPAFRRTTLRQHLQRHTIDDYHALLRHCAVIDRAIKGVDHADVWLLLEQFIGLTSNYLHI